MRKKKPLPFADQGAVPDDEGARLSEFRKSEPAGEAQQVKPIQEDFVGKRGRLAGEIAELAAEIEVEAYNAAASGKNVPAASDKTAFMGKYVAAPEEAANILDKTYRGRFIQHNPKMQELYDKIVEYKRGERSQEGMAHRASLEAPVGEDQIESVKSEIQRLQAERAEITQLLPEAVSQSHAAELERRSKLLEKAEAEKARKLADLQSTMNRQKFPGGDPVHPDEVYGGQGDQGGWEGRIVTSLDEIPLEASISKNLAGGGRTEESFRLAVVGALKQAEKGAGFELGDLDKEVPFPVAMRTLLPVLDPSGKVTQEMVGLVMKQRATGQQPQGGQEAGGGTVPAESDATLSELKMKQAERRDLLLSLGRDPSSQNWLSAIVTILLSAAIGSERALQVMGYASKTNSLKLQLDILNQEINEDIALLRDQRQGEREMKREAARRLQRTQDEQEVWRRQVGMALLNHKLIIERNEKKGNPETALMKKLQASYQRAVGMAAKYSGEMQNEFAPTDKRDQARANFNFYMKKAADLDMQLDDMGGDVLEEESEE